MIGLSLMGFVLAMTSAAAAPPDAAESALGLKNSEIIARHYPAEALRRGEEGTVGFRIDVDQDGSVLACKVTQSSGFASLDRATCDLLVRFANARPAVDDEGRRIRITKLGYIEWMLPTGAAAAAPVAAPGETLAEDLVCKRAAASGSRIRKIKRCMTPSEWRLEEQITNERLEEMLRSRTCGDHGC